MPSLRFKSRIFRICLYLRRTPAGGIRASQGTFSSSVIYTIYNASFRLKFIYDIASALLKPVSHQPCGSRAPVRVYKFLDFVRQPHGVVYYTARLPYEKQGRKAAQRIFGMFIFYAICLRFLRGVRQQQDTQGCRKTVARHARCSYD